MGVRCFFIVYSFSEKKVDRSRGKAMEIVVRKKTEKEKEAEEKTYGKKDRQSKSREQAMSWGRKIGTAKVGKEYKSKRK